jgi:hypothetical protein
VCRQRQLVAGKLNCVGQRAEQPAAHVQHPPTALQQKAIELRSDHQCRIGTGGTIAESVAFLCRRDVTALVAGWLGTALLDQGRDMHAGKSREILGDGVQHRPALAPQRCRGGRAKPTR